MDKRLNKLISAGVAVQDGKIRVKDIKQARKVLAESFGVTMEVIEEALVEMQSKDDKQIEIETAWKWTARAIACYLLFKETKELKWYVRAEDMRHESIEHAALAMDGGQTVQMVESEINPHRTTPEGLEEDMKPLDVVPLVEPEPLDKESEEGYDLL